MSLSLIETTYTSGAQVFPTNFALGILEVEHISVTSLDKTDGLGDPVVYEFTYDDSTGDVTVTDTLDAGEKILIKRSVPKESLYVEFVSSDITPRNIDNTVKQALMAVHEVLDQEEANRLIAQTALDGFEGVSEDVATAVAAAATATTKAGEAVVSANAANSDAATALAARNSAIGARDAAVVAQGAAEDAEDAAATSAMSAADDAAAAALSEAAAEAARDLALAYRNTTLTYRNEAQAARDAAITARNTTEGYRDTTLVYRNEAETFRDQAAASAASLTIASQAEAVAGTNNLKYMSPLRVKQSITANAPVKPNWTQSRIFSPGDNVSIFTRPVVSGRSYRYRGWNILNSTSGSSDRNFVFTALHSGGGFTPLLFLADLNDVRPFHFDIFVEHVNGSTQLYVQAASNAPATTGAPGAATTGWNAQGMFGPIDMGGVTIASFEFKVTNSTINDGAIDEYTYYNA